MTRNCVTVGCEHELADIPLDVELPKGFGRDIKDYTIVNSNGVANDPSGKLYRFGGEINTPPTSTAIGQQEVLQEILLRMPQARVNYRSNLHVHVRWPGLKQDLKMLKTVQEFIHKTMPFVLSEIEPIPHPIDDPLFTGNTEDEYQGAARRYKRRRVSHQTLLKKTRLAQQLDAPTITEFFAREVPRNKDKKPMWHMQPRLCVNLRQLLQTDTVEFRHFPGTLDHQELFTCVEWCVAYLNLATQGRASEIYELVEYWKSAGRFPKFPEYCHWQEVRYRATCHDGTLTRDEIRKNIAAIEAGTFDSMGVVPLPEAKTS